MIEYVEWSAMSAYKFMILAYCPVKLILLTCSQSAEILRTIITSKQGWMQSELIQNKGGLRWVNPR